MTVEIPQSRDDILREFKSIVRQHDQAAEKITTTAEEVERAKDQEVAQKAKAYTVESIVKGLADTQLGFAAALDSLAQTLSSESEKLDELQRAIGVEQTRLQELRSIRIAAEALHILTQENANRLSEWEEEATEERQRLDDTIERTRTEWTKEKEEYDAANVEYDAQLAKDRAEKEADFKYDRERKSKVDADKFEEKKRQLERQLAETQHQKNRNWSEREEVLQKASDEITELRAKTEAFSTELEEAVDKARSEAIKKAGSSAKVEAELLEKEVEGNTQVFELKIQTLDKTIGEQRDQLQTLMERLQQALGKSQDLAVQAVQGASKSAGI